MTTHPRSPVKQIVRDHTRFLSQFRENFHTTGSLLPSSRYLARALVRFVTPSDRPQRILEAGPGTGVVTRHIARRLGPQDALDVVELNPTFAEHVRHLVDTHPRFAPVADRIRVINDRLENIPGHDEYDVIVSGLPLSNFTPEAVEAILHRFADLIRPGGVLSFFEYIAIRSTRSVVTPSPADRARLRGLRRVFKEQVAANRIRRDWVWRNVPPAWVHHVVFDHPHAR